MANITPGGTRIARADSPLVPSVAAPPAPQPARPPTRDDFEVLSVCGSGEYGRVLMVRCRFNGQIYAMKVIAKTNLVLRGQARALARARRLRAEPRRAAPARRGTRGVAEADTRARAGSRVRAPPVLPPRAQSSVAQAIAESEILQTIRHPYIVSLHFAFQVCGAARGPCSLRV